MTAYIIIDNFVPPPNVVRIGCDFAVYDNTEHEVGVKDIEKRLENQVIQRKGQLMQECHLWVDRRLR